MSSIYNVSNIQPELCYDESTPQLFQALRELEGQIQTQNEIDKIYDDFRTIVKNEMSSKLPKKEYVIKGGVCNKRRQIRKPWWNLDLQCLWNEMCRAEKNMFAM